MVIKTLPPVTAMTPVHTGMGMSVASLESPPITAPTADIDTLATGVRDKLAASDLSRSIIHPLCIDTKARSVIDYVEKGDFQSLLLGFCAVIPPLIGGFLLSPLIGVPAGAILASISALISGGYVCVSASCKSFNPRHWSLEEEIEKVISSYPRLFTEGFEGRKWRVFVERTILFDPAQKKQSEHALARLTRRLREHRISLKQFLKEPRPVKAPPQGHVPLVGSEDEREYLTGRDVRQIFAWSDDYRVVADYAAIAWSIRASGKKLSPTFRDYESPAEFFDGIMYMMTGKAPHRKIDGSLLSTEYTANYVNLLQSIDGYVTEKDLPTPAIASAAYLLRYHQQVGHTEYADRLLEGMHAYLNSKPAALKEYHAKIAQAMRASPEMTAEDEAVAALHELLK